MTARLARNDGFTTVAILVVMMLSSLLVIAAFATANNGTPLSRNDQNEKEAYSAAEAGVAFYAYHVAQDPNYWTYCTNPPNSASLTPNPLWDGTSGMTRNWRDIPDPGTASPGGEANPPQYSITLVAPQGSTKCQTGLAASTFLNPQNGTFTIRSTGVYRNHKRSILATFKRKSFVDFLWFTDFETPDPETYPLAQQNAAGAACGKYAFPTPGNTPRVLNSTTPCEDQSFISADVMDGPMHTNDRFLTCGTPTFGNNSSQAIEMGAPAPGYTAACGPASPNFAGTAVPGAQNLPFPASNGALASDTLSGWTYTGPTKLSFVISGGTTKVNVTNNGTTTLRALPANGVIFVANGVGCANTGYQEAQQYQASPCGDVTVDGSYNTSLTIGADNDLIVDGNLLSTDPMAEMGLIANGFIRVYHPVNFQGNPTCSASSPDLPTGFTKPNGDQSIEIDAAILSVKHSFLVDNPKCGDPLGTLTVNGAIAQKFRGTVGTHDSNGNVATGYTKDYIYDEALKFADPPYFLDPIQSSWHIVRQTEQVPAT